MSRCFPFPPPGYERKHRPEEIDLLKEAKRKEQKHKRDRKDKDRSKDKGKGEKDGSDEKHRDKKNRKGKHKDKKEKHRDKKDRGKDKEKSSISEESTVAGKLGEKGHESLRPKGECKDRSSIVDEGKISAPLPGQNGGRPFQNSQPSLENKESKFLQELDRRIRADETSRASQLADGLAGLDKRDQEAASRSAARNSSGTLAEEKLGYNKDKRVDTRKMDAQGFRNEVTGNSTAQNFTTFDNSKVDGIPRPEEEYIERRWEDKEKSKEIGDNKQRDKHKEKDNKRVEKEKDRKKKKEEKKNKEKVKVEAESKKTEEEIPRDLVNNDLVGVTSNKDTDFLKDVKNSVITDGNIKKRKDMATNGFVLENEKRPIKMPRLPPHQSTENGRKLEAYRTPSTSASNKHVVPNSVRLDKCEQLINGMVEAQKSSSLKPITSSTVIGNQNTMIGAQKSYSSKPITSSTMIGDQHPEGSKVSLHNSSYSNKTPPEPKMEDPIAEAARRPPHPDSKYLNEVLTVPKLGDWSENDDHDWLFSKQPPSTKMKSGSVLVEEQCVWSEAVLLESDDICAMPFVIPY